MSVTLDTSHLQMSPLNNPAWANMRLMSVTLDTSHSPIGPCGNLEQSSSGKLYIPSGDNFRHATTALLRAALDCGENTESPGINASLPAQIFGAMHVRSVRKMIRRCQGKRICACWYIALLYLCVYVYLYSMPLVLHTLHCIFSLSMHDLLHICTVYKTYLYPRACLNHPWIWIMNHSNVWAFGRTVHVLYCKPVRPKKWILSHLRVSGSFHFKKKC